MFTRYPRRLPKGELLLVDAPELIERFLQQEQVRSAGALRGRDCASAPTAFGEC
jgi:hypothetical protein